MEVENPLASIEQWYKRATALDRNWRESRREEERLRGRKDQGGGASKQEQQQSLPQPLVWQRRQMPQQATMGPAPIEGVERTNAVVVRGSEPGVGQSVGIPPRQDSFAMEIDRGRNCYACGCYESRLKVFKSRNNSWIGVTQENSIEFLIQSSLPSILLLMVHASYCAPYPK